MGGTFEGLNFKENFMGSSSSPGFRIKGAGQVRIKGAGWVPPKRNSSSAGIGP